LIGTGGDVDVVALGEAMVEFNQTGGADSPFSRALYLWVAMLAFFFGLKGGVLASLAAFETLPDDTLVLPSHGLPFRGIRARVEALRDHHRARLAELVDALAAAGGSATAAEVVPVLFRRELDLQQRFFAIGEAIAHLNHLAASGRLVRETSPDGRIRFALPPKPRPS